MELISACDIYGAFLAGAREVICNKDELNKINVYPVPDGDTGSNMASMMVYITKTSICGESVKDTISSIANASIDGARGNSGMIFSQYLNGISVGLDESEKITVENFVKACKLAFSYAYESISNPVEGTMLSVMREWSKALDDMIEENYKFEKLLENSYGKVEKALENTKNQLEVLKRNSVVDSGAKGFTLFIKGLTEYIKNPDKREDGYLDVFNNKELEVKINELDGHFEKNIKYRYCTEVFIEGEKLRSEEIRKSVYCMGDSLVLAGNSGRIKVHIHTDEPKLLIQKVEKYGNVIGQKIEDIKSQIASIYNRNSDIAILTDSIADLPQEIIDRYQVHVTHLKMNVDDKTYIDKITINNADVLRAIKDGKKVISSQPTIKSIEAKISWLLTYYKNVVIIPVGKELSGTYNVFLKVAQKIDPTFDKIKIVDSKLNSVAEGMVVLKCAELIEEGKDIDNIIKLVKKIRDKTNILVSIRSLDGMVRSGRLNGALARIANIINMKPIITLDKEGKGKIKKIAFGKKSRVNKIISILKSDFEEYGISEFSIVHVNNEEDAKKYARKIEKILGIKPKYICKASSIIASSAGDGCVGVAYIKN